MYTMQVPDALEMLEFFETEPVEAAPQDGYWRYDVVDSSGVKLRLSLNTHERSVEVALSREGRQLVTVTEEKAVRLVIRGEVLIGEFEAGSIESKLELRIKPEIQVRWSRLAIA